MAAQGVIVIDGDDEPKVRGPKRKVGKAARRVGKPPPASARASGEARVYLLHAGDETREVTYIGCTYDVDRRLRQHKCEVAGGAKFTTRWTKKGLLWKVACTVQVPSLTAARILERQWKKQANVVNSRASQKQLALVERKRVALDEVLAKYGALNKPQVMWAEVSRTLAAQGRELDEAVIDLTFT